jgi:hypothetical protein
MTIEFTPEAIVLHREHAAMAAMVDTDTFRDALAEIERLTAVVDLMRSSCRDAYKFIDGTVLGHYVLNYEDIDESMFVKGTLRSAISQ